MKKFTKILALMLALVMVLSVFAACKNSKQEEESDTGSETTAEPETTTKERDNTVKIMDDVQFNSLVEQLNKDPEASKGVTYKLYRDVTFSLTWDPSPSSAYGKLVGPDAISAFPGIKEFYGEFDGQDNTITAVYRVNDDTEVTAVGGFIDKLNGGTVKNLTLNNAYVFDGTGSAKAVGGFVGVVNGEGAVLENITVNSSVYAAHDGAVNVGGVVGAVEAGNFTMTNVTFGGKAGNVGADLVIPSPSTTAVLGQLIGNSGSNTVTVTGCKANGELICNTGATQDNFVGAGSAVTESGSTAAPTNTGIVEMTEYKIYTPEELYAVAAYDDTFEGKTVRLLEDITLNEDGAAEPILWTGLTEFKGTFDGNGRRIFNLHIEAADTENVGFIKVLNGGTVKNLSVFDSTVAYASETVPANVGFIGKAVGGVVEQLYFELDVTATGAAASNVGGIVGKAEGAAKVRDILYNGALVGVTGGKTDAIVADQSAEATVSDVLCYSNSLTLATAGRTNAYKGVQTVELEDIGWGEAIYKYADSTFMSTYAPMPVCVLLSTYLVYEADISWYNEGENEFHISNAEQLLGLSKLAQPTYQMDGENYVLDEYGMKVVETPGKTFKGKTIYIDKDISLNPNWDATTTVSSADVVTLARTPNNPWTPIPCFEGTIDGQGHRINGMYVKTEFISVDGVVFYWGGFITELKNGTITDLIVDNGLAHFLNEEHDEGHSTIRIGGFIAHCLDSTLTDLYVDIDTWVEFIGRCSLSGMINSIDTEHYEKDTSREQVPGAYVGTVKNLVYAGSVGRILVDSNGNKRWNVPTEIDGTYTATGMIGANWTAGSASKIVNFKAENLSMIGTVYMPQISAGGMDHSFVMQDTTSKEYNFGMAVNNFTVYVNGVYGRSWKEANSSNLTEPGQDWCTNVSIGDVAKDQTNKKCDEDATKPNPDDTYTADAWATITIANGAGVATPILLPKTVVDMLNAHPAYAPAS